MNSGELGGGGMACSSVKEKTMKGKNSMKGDPCEGVKEFYTKRTRSV
jgi:hypothetical protein